MKMRLLLILSFAGLAIDIRVTGTVPPGGETTSAQVNVNIVLEEIPLIDSGAAPVADPNPTTPGMTESSTNTMGEATTTPDTSDTTVIWQANPQGATNTGGATTKSSAVQPTTAPTITSSPALPTEATTPPAPTSGPPAPATTPSSAPTTASTAPPTAVPTTPPTGAPTTPPTAAPTAPPTAAPTTPPTVAPTAPPTAAPTTPPTVAPTAPPTTASTTVSPTSAQAAKTTPPPPPPPPTTAAKTTPPPTPAPTAPPTTLPPPKPTTESPTDILRRFLQAMNPYLTPQELDKRVKAAPTPTQQHLDMMKRMLSFMPKQPTLPMVTTPAPVQPPKTGPSTSTGGQTTYPWNPTWPNMMGPNNMLKLPMWQNTFQQWQPNNMMVNQQQTNSMAAYALAQGADMNPLAAAALFSSAGNQQPQNYPAPGTGTGQSNQQPYQNGLSNPMNLALLSQGMGGEMNPATMAIGMNPALMQNPLYMSTALTGEMPELGEGPMGMALMSGMFPGMGGMGSGMGYSGTGNNNWGSAGGGAAAGAGAGANSPAGGHGWGW